MCRAPRERARQKDFIVSAVCTESNHARHYDAHVNLNGNVHWLRLLHLTSKRKTSPDANARRRLLAASFVQSAEEVQFIRRALRLWDRSIEIISKFVNEDGLKNIDAIIQESDGIMVARGDQGTLMPV